MFAPSDYRFALPPELIAQEATDDRAASRLLHVDGDALVDLAFPAIVDLLPADAILVVNDTRVIPARVLTTKPSGGAIELLFLEPEDIPGPSLPLGALRVGARGWRCLARGTVRPGMRLTVAGADTNLTVATERAADGSIVVTVDDPDVLAFLDRHGHVPLPHYIERPDRADDRERYQTMFARHPGAVAAPTAGLHVTPGIAERLVARGIAIAPVTLHVGWGTFEPIRVDDIRAHRMHRERYVIPEATAALVATGRPVVALGTTALRAVESAATAPHVLATGPGATELFVHPGSGHAFRIASHLITNFHLPESTLLMLVCAFAGTAGRARMLRAYQHAVAQRYRFFSYGDAMLLHHAP